MNTLKVGDKVPEFECFDEQGNIVKSSDFLNKRWVVFFYPKANTPGCTKEACNIRDDFARLKEEYSHILGVSADSQKKQLAFKEKYNFPYPLLADEDKKVINIFGVWGPKKFMGKEYEGIHRITFIMDEDSKVIRVIDKVKTNNHANQILIPE